MLYPYPDILLNPMSLLLTMDHNNNTVAKIDIESLFLHLEGFKAVSLLLCIVDTIGT